MKLRFIAATIILLLALGCSSFGASTFKQLATSYPTNKALASIDMTTVLTGCAVGFDRNIWKTTDGALSWTSVESEAVNTNFFRIRFSRDNPDLGYATYFTGWFGTPTGLFKTTNNGSSWSEILTIPANYLFGVYSIDSSHLWICGKLDATHEVGFSSINGSSWNYYDTGGEIGLLGYDIYFFDANTGIASAWAGIWRSINGGVDWTKVLSASNHRFDALDFYNSSIGWAVGIYTAGPNAIIYKTTDGGSSWEAQTLPTLPSGTELYSVSVIDQDNVWAVGTNNVVLRTTDGGTTWTRVTDGLPGGALTTYGGAKFLDQYNGWVVGSTEAGNSLCYKWVVDPTVTTNGVYQTGDPTKTSIPQGYSGNIDINGTNLREDTVLNAGAGVTINSITPVAATSLIKAYTYPTLRVNVTVSSDATSGVRGLTVSNPDTGITTYAAFSISPKPNVTTVEPVSALQGWTGYITIEGTGFVTGATVDMGSDISVLGANVISSTRISALIDVSSTASLGAHTVTVTNPDNGEGTGTFSVTQAINPPSISNVYFNTSPYFDPSRIGTIEVSRTPTIKFDLNTPQGISISDLKLYVYESGGYAPYSIPASAYSGSSTSGQVTYAFPGLMPIGYPEVRIYVQDLNGAGATQICEVYVRDPATAPESITAVVPYPCPWNPDSIQEPNLSFEFDSTADMPGCYLNVVSISNRTIMHREQIDIKAGLNKFLWDGVFANKKIANGAYSIIISKGNNTRLGGGNVVVFRR